MISHRRFLQLSLMVLTLAGAGVLVSCSLSQTTQVTKPVTNTLAPVLPKINSKRAVAKAQSVKPIAVPAEVKTARKPKIISIKSSEFNPAKLKVAAGTIVQWVNKDSAVHTVTGDTANGLVSPKLAKGRTYTHVFSDLGTFSYHCSIHPTMKGTVTVTK